MTLSGDSLNKIDKPHLLREFFGYAITKTTSVNVRREMKAYQLLRKAKGSKRKSPKPRPRTSRNVKFSCKGLQFTDVSWKPRNQLDDFTEGVWQKTNLYVHVELYTFIVNEVIDNSIDIEVLSLELCPRNETY